MTKNHSHTRKYVFLVHTLRKSTFSQDYIQDLQQIPPNEKNKKYQFR